MTSEPLNQYTEICRDAIKSSSAKITECGKGDDEGKWDAVFHGFFQGGHGKHIHR